MDVVTAQKMYERDRAALEYAGIEGHVLMENAGRAAAQDLIRHVQPEQSILILIGSGQNGGDGFVIARTLLNRGYKVEAWQVVPDDKITGDAALHKGYLLNSGYPIFHVEEESAFAETLTNAEVIIDAMLGIGVKGKLRPPFDRVLKKANQTKALRLAVDIPTGVPADEGVEVAEAFEADYTCVIAALKESAFLQHTRAYYGEWNVVEIGLPQPKLPPTPIKVWTEADVKRTFPRRHAFSHKGSHGKGMVIGGSYSMPGSVAMASKAALKAGAGLITVAAPYSTIPALAAYNQETTFLPLQENQQGLIIEEVSREHFEGMDGIALGMGLGRHEDGQALVAQALRHADQPLVIDADGLYHIPRLQAIVQNREAPVILTPHPGEMAHLLGVSVSELMMEPFRCSREFVKQYGTYLVLKGPATIITSPSGEQRVELSGNAGLAKGGTGDVLSGILLALIMQSDDILEGLCNGCHVHGKTAEQLIGEGHSEMDMLATDVIEGLARTLRTFSS
ncbi:NAD(P)H-hydrate dehydratase [Thalassobacillus sp. CUG 92003]|uniref:NAD(P)H-hydrate dehydratase n=1 Tax=Thalassobacillus sp. CUG 92003 TaxID=2736641 RepID=UPI0015E77724|nr:NAD(P)H-hydrate dehydratase [Thalassobacillus sp. CUG 92003]